VDLFFGLQGESPENGSFLGFGWRLLGILSPKSSNIGLQRLLAMRKARILGREDSNLRMVESKSAAKISSVGSWAER
jgi:hypothetical protein